MQLGRKAFSHHHALLSQITLRSNYLAKYTALKSTSPLFNYSFRSFHVHVTNLNHDDGTVPDDENHLHTTIFKLIRKQEYSTAKRTLKKLTKNWFGFYKYNSDNQLALYLHGLVLLESSKDCNENAKNLKPLQLSSDNGDKMSHLLLATLSYLNDSQVENENYRNYLEKFDESVNWNEKMVELTIETYLKELIQSCDSRFAYYALGKFYMKNQKYQQAYEAFTRSTEKKFKKGQYELGLLMRNGSPDGEISKNTELALELFKKIRFEEQGHKQLVEMYWNGESTNYFKAVFHLCTYYLYMLFTNLFLLWSAIALVIKIVHIVSSKFDDDDTDY